MSSAHSEQIRPDVENRSVGELIGELSSDLSTLMRQEVALAKAELTQEASKAGQAAGMLAGAGVAAHLAIIFASLTAMWALGNVMNLAWAALIVTGGLLAIHDVFEDPADGGRPPYEIWRRAATSGDFEPADDAGAGSLRILRRQP